MKRIALAIAWLFSGLWALAQDGSPIVTIVSPEVTEEPFRVCSDVNVSLEVDLSEIIYKVNIKRSGEIFTRPFDIKLNLLTPPDDGGKLEYHLGDLKLKKPQVDIR